MINSPANARNINVKAEGTTGLAWEPWRTSVDLKKIIKIIAPAGNDFLIKKNHYCKDIMYMLY